MEKTYFKIDANGAPRLFRGVQVGRWHELWQWENERWVSDGRHVHAFIEDGQIHEFTLEECLSNHGLTSANFEDILDVSRQALLPRFRSQDTFKIKHEPSQLAKSVELWKLCHSNMVKSGGGSSTSHLDSINRIAFTVTSSFPPSDTEEPEPIDALILILDARIDQQFGSFQGFTYVDLLSWGFDEDLVNDVESVERRSFSYEGFLMQAYIISITAQLVASRWETPAVYDVRVDNFISELKYDLMIPKQPLAAISRMLEKPLIN